MLAGSLLAFPTCRAATTSRRAPWWQAKGKGDSLRRAVGIPRRRCESSVARVLWSSAEAEAAMQIAPGTPTGAFLFLLLAPSEGEEAVAGVDNSSPKLTSPYRLGGDGRAADLGSSSTPAWKPKHSSKIQERHQRKKSGTEQAATSQRRRRRSGRRQQVDEAPTTPTSGADH